MKRRLLTATLSALLIISSIDIFAQQTYNLPTYEQGTNTSSGTIEVYLPKADKANGCAVVLCPGGGMRALAWDSDVKQMASFLNERGIAAIGLRYHLYTQITGAPRGGAGMQMAPMVDVTKFEQFPQADANPMHYPAGDSIIQLAANDGKAAIKYVRQHAKEWNIDEHKIGFLGFSAGGGVAVGATIQATDPMERPDFLCSCYGPSLMKVTVPQQAPPLLIMTRAEHPNVAAGLLALFLEWKKAGANAELHVYSDGRGPYTLMPETGNTTTEAWSQQLILWLKAKGFAK